MSDEFNMSMRKFLKQVGVTSQQAIEKAVREAREAGTLGDSLQVRAVVTIDGLEMQHEVTGTIRTAGAPE
jgi:transcription elongation GreA/GreB family factor